MEIWNPKRIRSIEIPESIGCCKKFRKKTNWLPIIDIDTTLSDILYYWDQKMKFIH